MIVANYILLLVALVLHAPDVVWQQDSRAFLFFLGIIGIWRYGWGFCHFVRAWCYRNIVFARHRRQLDRLRSDADNGNPQTIIGPSELYIIVTSFRIQAETTAAVYRSIFEEAARTNRKVTVIASVVEIADQRFIKQIWAGLAHGNLAAGNDDGSMPYVSLVFVRLAGKGKRDAVAVALNAVKRLRPSPDAAIALMDGDTILPPGSIDKTLPYFAMLPTIGGLTTDEDSLIVGDKVIGAWHRLRFAQRQILMSSMALSGKLMVMTGRFSVFRANIATDPAFVDTIRNDYVDHWRLGKIKLLTGEDKSTWYWLLKHGWGMFYVPDVRILTVEHPPTNEFLTSATMLMARWFGNMLRANGRAIAFGPSRCGWFVWWCLIDQRVSMWTPLIGPIAVIMASAVFSLWILYAYLIWVMLTRLIQTLMLLSVRDTISGLYPPLIYFSQVYGALIKTFVLFRPNRQRWTRQDISSQSNGENRLTKLQSSLLQILAFGYLIASIGFFLGVLQWPSTFSMAQLI